MPCSQEVRNIMVQHLGNRVFTQKIIGQERAQRRNFSPPVAHEQFQTYKSLLIDSSFQYLKDETAKNQIQDCNGSKIPY